MPVHGFSDKGWNKHKAEHKDFRSGKRQVHLRKAFYRRGRGRGGGGATKAIAVVKGTVPAASGFDITGTLTEGADVGTFGVLDANFTSSSITAGALIVEYDATGDDARVVFKGGEPYVLPVINPSYMQFIPPSTGSPIMGTIATYDNEEYFVLPTMDPRSRPGWTAGNDQSIGHDIDGMEEWQDDDLCE